MQRGRVTHEQWVTSKGFDFKNMSRGQFHKSWSGKNKTGLDQYEDRCKLALIDVHFLLPILPRPSPPLATPQYHSPTQNCVAFTEMYSRFFPSFSLGNFFLLNFELLHSLKVKR